MTKTMENDKDKSTFARLLTAAAVAACFATAAPTTDAATRTENLFATYMIVPAGVAVPSATLSFDVVPYDGDVEAEGAAAEAAPDVLPTDGKIDVDRASFGPDDPTHGEIQKGDRDVARAASERAVADGGAGAIGFDGDAAERYAHEVEEICFSDVPFPEEGTYRHLVTMSLDGGGAEGRGLSVGDARRVMDVLVRKDGVGRLAASGLDMYSYDKENDAAGYSFVAKDGFYEATPSTAEGYADAVSEVVGEAAGEDGSVKTSYVTESEPAIPDGVAKAVLVLSVALTLLMAAAWLPLKGIARRKKPDEDEK